MMGAKKSNIIARLGDLDDLGRPIGEALLLGKD
jgi:hypothetical protein